MGVFSTWEASPATDFPSRQEITQILAELSSSIELLPFHRQTPGTHLAVPILTFALLAGGLFYEC
jgi:hypothetical protein